VLLVPLVFLSLSFYTEQLYGTSNYAKTQTLYKDLSLVDESFKKQRAAW
jgi:hypothetical protein